MTFDEAYNMLNLKSDNLGYWQGGQFRLVTDVMAGLKETYAKPVEMTQRQKNSFEEYSYRWCSLDLLEQGILKLVATDVWGVSENAITETQVEDLMRAWLHPELIKEVE